MRVFVALWPPPPVLDAVAALTRPDHAALRWTTRDQWHLTVRFLGEVDDELPALASTLEAGLGGQSPLDVGLGPAVSWLGRPGRSPLVVPAEGVAGLARAVLGCTAGFGRAPERRPYRGHLTVARVRHRRSAPPSVAGEAIHATWRADRVAVVRSRLDPGGASYETLAEVPLGGPSPD